MRKMILNLILLSQVAELIRNKYYPNSFANGRILSGH